MTKKMPKYRHPDFEKPVFKYAPNASYQVVIKDGIAPDNYHAMSIFPEYFKINDRWFLATESRMDTVCVIDDTPGYETLRMVEFRNLKRGDKVVIGRKDDGSQGIYVWTQGFDVEENKVDSFTFRSGRSRETAFSIDYDNLYELLEYEKNNDGKIVLVIGTAVVLDRDSRNALENLIKEGYISAIFCGTETAAIDLEIGLYQTYWGQDVFVREQNSFENLYDTINLINKYGSIKEFLAGEDVKDGFVKACYKYGVDLVIPGTIRDRFPLPETIDNIGEAQDTLRSHMRKANLVISMGAILFTIATGNMTPSYNEKNGEISPVIIYTVDIQEFAVNKLSDRGSMTAISVVTNVQDFMRNLNRALIKGR